MTNPGNVHAFAIFGIGWGLSGICPGPSLILLTRPGLHAVSFFVGVVLGTLVASRRPRSQGVVTAR
jgi:uncharacterized membrane protein YedE/YeeE